MATRMHSRLRARVHACVLFIVLPDTVAAQLRANPRAQRLFDRCRLRDTLPVLQPFEFGGETVRDTRVQGDGYVARATPRQFRWGCRSGAGYETINYLLFRRLRRPLLDSRLRCASLNRHFQTPSDTALSLLRMPWCPSSASL